MMRAAFDAMGTWGNGSVPRALLDAAAQDHGGSSDHDDAPSARRYRTIFISDLHLGTPGCQAEALLDFMKSHPSDYLYLVGDIIDGWQLRRKWYWPQSHNDVVQKLLRRARKGCRVIFVPGNHDEFARAFVATSLVALRSFTMRCTQRLMGVACGLPMATTLMASFNAPNGWRTWGTTCTRSRCG
jgi:hypothetical protein